MINNFDYQVNAASLPEAEDLFNELEEAQSEVERIKDEITEVFNDSTTRQMLNGFITGGNSDLTIKWNGATANISIKIITEGK